MMGDEIEKFTRNSGNPEDIAALEKIYSENKELVFNLCCRYFTDRSEAEDACHDIFIKIFKNLSSFRDESKLSTWIYRLTVNHCLNCIRRKRIVNWLSLDFMNSDENLCDKIPADNSDTENDYVEKERAELLRTALEKLPDRQKTALLLHKYDDLSYQQIAEIMECSVSSVESLIFRAKQTLSKQLLKYKK